MSCAVGVDIGGTKMLAVRLHAAAGTQCTGAGATVGAERRAPTPGSGPEVADAIGGLVAHLGGAAAAIGVGVPGLVGSDGTLRFSAHLPGLVGFPLAAVLAGRHPAARVWVGNDATAATWAEHTLGAGRGHGDMLMVTLGTGIGGGIVAGGVLVEGARRFAGDWGHMIVDPHGPPCPCGQRGCWERFASGAGLGRLGRDAATAGRASRLVELAGGDPEAVRGEHVTVAAGEGDAEALSVMAAFAWWLALGLANLTNVLDPDVIVLGGGLVDAGEVLLAPTREAFPRLVEGGSQRRVPIVAAELGPAAGAVGAAVLAALR